MRSIDWAALLVWSVEKTRWPVSAAVITVCIVLPVAHLADHDDVGVLPEHVLQGLVEARRVGRDLALGDGGLAVGEQELDRVLDRDDVDRPLLDDRTA